MHRINMTLVYFLIFTVVSSTLAFYILVKAYDDTLQVSYEEVQ